MPDNLRSLILSGANLCVNQTSPDLAPFLSSCPVVPRSPTEPYRQQWDLIYGRPVAFLHNDRWKSARLQCTGNRGKPIRSAQLIAVACVQSLHRRLKGRIGTTALLCGWRHVSKTDTVVDTGGGERVSDS